MSMSQVLEENRVLDEAGQAVALDSLWGQGPLVLALVRHFG